MSQSVFKGQIKKGAISATFQSDFSNIDSDVLVQSYRPSPNGDSLTEVDVAAPGGSAKTTFTASSRGVLDIFVATGHETESGRLVVKAGNKTMHDEPIQGPVRWMYVVV